MENKFASNRFFHTIRWLDFRYDSTFSPIPMSKEDKIEVEGVIIKTLPGAVFEVKTPEELGGYVVQAYISGKMRKNFINLIE